MGTLAVVGGALQKGHGRGSLCSDVGGDGPALCRKGI